MAMKKFLNNPERLTTELLEGMALAFPEKVTVISGKIVCRTHLKPENKVRIVTLGGSGHEPALSGFVGQGMLDYSVVGDIFSAPGAPKVFKALQMADCDAGILLVVLNHEGDVMAANMAMEMARREGMNIRMLLTHDDISTGLNSDIKNRRGLAGCVPIYKIAGAAAEAGLHLDEVYAIAERFNKNMATLPAVLKTATHPQSGLEIANLTDHEMEIGMGQGGGRCAILSANETTEIMLDQLCEAVQVREGDELLVMVNGVGATTLRELYLINRAAHSILCEKGVKVECNPVGEFFTVQEMAGFQLCIARVDAEIKALWNAPSDAPFWVTR